MKDDLIYCVCLAITVAVIWQLFLNAFDYGYIIGSDAQGSRLYAVKTRLKQQGNILEYPFAAKGRAETQTGSSDCSIESRESAEKDPA